VDLLAGIDPSGMFFFMYLEARVKNKLLSKCFSESNMTPHIPQKTQ
jgi:hypothetical protein